MIVAEALMSGMGTFRHERYAPRKPKADGLNDPTAFRFFSIK